MRLSWDPHSDSHKVQRFIIKVVLFALLGRWSWSLWTPHVSATGLRGATEVQSPAFAIPPFKLDPADHSVEEALHHHSGDVGAVPTVRCVRDGEGGLFGVRGTVHLPMSADQLFLALTDPEQNQRIFVGSKLNYRKPLDTYNVATRVFEVSKTGYFSILGMRFSWESTVLALEDWHAREIRYWLKKPGAMKHLSGYWRLIPVSPNQTIAFYFGEAVPAFPLPGVFKTFAVRACESVASKLLEDLRKAAATWLKGVDVEVNFHEESVRNHASGIIENISATTSQHGT